MNYLSVCSGIEAASVAWHPLGWQPHAFSEIERFPSQVLAHHYPDVPNLGDITKYREWPNASIDLLVGGTPCQSFSVAGLRKGLGDPRGNLMLTYGAIAGRYRPRWLVWENVPGVLSSNGGRDFGTFLGMLAELGYGFAYRILDAQYIRVDGFARAVPQRRRRVFVVGYLGDWRRAAAVLFERESLCGHPAPSRKERQEPAVRSVASVALRGRDGGAAAELGDDCAFTLRAAQGGGDKPHVLTWPAEVASTLNAAFGSKQGLEDQCALRGGSSSSLPSVSLCLNAGAMGRLDAETETLIPTIGGVFDVAPCLTGNYGKQPDSSNTSAGPMVIPVAFSCKDHGADAGEVSPTLRSMGHDGSHANGGGQVAIAIRTANTSSNGHGFSDEIAYTLDRTQGQAVAFAHQAGGIQTTLGYDPDAGTSPTLAKCQTPAIDTGMAVRRLTPTECERLQGFPSVTQKVIIEVCIDRQLNVANVALSCLKWLDNVLLVDESGLTPSVETAVALSNTRQVGQEPLVAVHVRMHYEAKLLAVRNHGKSILCANGAEPSGKYLHHPQTGDTVPALAQVALELANLIRSGKAGSLQSTSLSLPESAGSKLVPQSGGEIAGNAADVETVPSVGKFTTSDLGLLTPISATPIAICCCSAMAAISGFIQIETLPENFSLELIVESDYTDIRHGGKATPDGPRYKALGNSMAIPPMRWIGQRIAMVDAIQALKVAV